MQLATEPIKVNTRVMPNLWREFKVYAATNGLKLEGAINAAIGEFLAKRKPVRKRR